MLEDLRICTSIPILNRIFWYYFYFNILKVSQCYFIFLLFVIKYVGCMFHQNRYLRGIFMARIFKSVTFYCQATHVPYFNSWHLVGFYLNTSVYNGAPASSFSRWQIIILYTPKHDVDCIIPALIDYWLITNNSLILALFHGFCGQYLEICLMFFLA